MSYSDLVRDIKENQVNQSLVSLKKVEKWSRTGLLEGLTDRRKVQMARLLENQAMMVMLKEASDTSDIKGFQSVAFPMVRRVFGQLLAQEIVSVQPMSLPSGLIFWLDYTFGTSKAGAQNSKDWATGKSVYGDPISPLTGGADATGGHYNLHNSYTHREATGSLEVISSASVTAWSEVDYDLELSSAVANSGLHKLTVDLDDDATITNIDDTNFKSFALSGAAASIGATTVFYRRHNTYVPSTKILTMYYSGTALVGGGVNSGTAVKVSYVKKASLSADTTGTTLNPAWEYAFDSTDTIPQIDIKIASFAVTANDRKLKVVWTPELAQDLNAYHSLDAEAELTQLMADQVAMDIDSEILVDIVNNVKAAPFYWDARPGFFVDRSTGAPTPGPSFTGNVQQWYSTLLIRVLDASNQIHRKTLRGGANFMVTSPDVCTILESLVEWRPVMDFSDASVTKFSMGAEKVGTLSSRFTVYKVPFFYRNVILVGHKGDEWLSTGYVYAPYIPLIITPTIYDPTNFQPTKGAMTRYAKQIVRGDMFAKVVVKGLGL